MVCSRTNIASCVLSYLCIPFFFFSFLSQKYTNVINIVQWQWMRMTQLNILSPFFYMIKSMNEYVKKKKDKNLSIECVTQGYTKYAYVYNSLENLFELVVVTLNRILLPFSKQCILFLIRFFFNLFDNFTSITYGGFLLFLSYKLLFKHTSTHIYKWRNNPERTLNYNVDETNTI